MSQGIFPDKQKIAKVTPIYKNDENTDLGSNRTILVLPCTIASLSIHEVIFKKIKLYGAAGKNYSWLENYLSSSIVIGVASTLSFLKNKKKHTIKTTKVTKSN